MHHDGLTSAGSAFVYASNQSHDSDNDGLSDYLENLLGCTTGDVDSDDDGLLDGEEATNWTSDAMSFDTDADGISDGVERGVSAPSPGTDLSLFIPDADPLSSSYAFLIDSDQGDAPDGGEDLNANGRVDVGELDPMDASDDLLVLVVSPLSPGQPVTLDVSTAIPSSQIYFLWSEVGTGPLYLPNKGVTLSLSSPVNTVGIVTADAAGTASLLRTLPASTLIGKLLWFQCGEISPVGVIRLSNMVEGSVL